MARDASRSRRRGSSAARNPARLALLALLLVIGALFAWRTAIHALAHYYASTDPDIAVRMDGDDPEALLNLSDGFLSGKGRSRDLNAAAAGARAVLERAPLQAGALRNLGLIADAANRKGEAAVIMARAGRRGLRDVPTQAWLLDHALRALDFGPAMLRLDALMRVAPELNERLLPLLASLVNNPKAMDGLSRRLATEPPWRPAVLHYLSDHAPDAAPVVALYQRLARLDHPPNDDEASALLARLTKDGRYDEGYLLWVSFLPRRAMSSLGDLYDGDFHGLPGSPPFNWKLAQTPGTTVEFAKPSGSTGTALYVEYPVADGAQLADQLLVLPAGAYRLSGRFMVTGPAAGAHLSWTVQCAGSPAPVLVQVRQNAEATSGWTPFSAAFVVPADCNAQWLRLAGLAGDGFGELSAWNDHLSIDRVSPADASAAK